MSAKDKCGQEGQMGIGRRSFLGVAGATLVDIGPALAQRGGTNACLSQGIPSRTSGPVEVAFKAPHGQPNGLAQGPNPGELWVQDRGIGRQVTLIQAKDGNIIREITADAIGPSGLTMADDGRRWHNVDRRYAWRNAGLLRRQRWTYYCKVFCAWRLPDV